MNKRRRKKVDYSRKFRWLVFAGLAFALYLESGPAAAAAAVWGGLMCEMLLDILMRQYAYMSHLTRELKLKTR